MLQKRVLIKNEFAASLFEQIRYSEHEKLSILDQNFSISHNNGYVVITFGTSFSVGFDIEKRRARYKTVATFGYQIGVDLYKF